MLRVSAFVPIFLALLFDAPLSATEGKAPSYEQIRPILKELCFHCHGESGRLEGKLDVRMARLIHQGGESGQLVVAGKPKESLLLQRIVDGEMPPEEVETRPTKSQVEQIRQWIQAGAKTASPEPMDIDPSEYITQEERSFWAFQPVRRPALPRVKLATQADSPIDYFLLAKLEKANLKFAPLASRRTLLRRAYSDIIGLPPTPEQVQAFLSNQRPDAYERLVDQLLHSPGYGERWGRHWLDVAGYADSEGASDQDPLRADAYKYRDYVIDAFNQGKPFDTFIREQLAGDELIGRKLENLTEQEREWLIATGFLRMAPDGTSVSNTIETRNENISKSMEIVSTSLLGLTVGCAQCHDHRYDPISQRDYYRFRAIFEPAFDMQQWRVPSRRRVSLYTDADRKRAAEVEAEAKKLDAARSVKQQAFIEAVFQRELAKLPSELREEVKLARNTKTAKRTPRQAQLLRQHPSVNVSAGSLYLYDAKAAETLKSMSAKAKKLRETKPKEEFVRALTEKPGRVPKSFVFFRGSPQQPRDEVTPNEISVLARDAWDVSASAKGSTTSGRRTAYAKWLTSGRHATVSRVLVNRIWLNHFGRGLVQTPGDFGRLGTSPTHPDLLDWLADEFVRSGWNVRHIQRLILISHAYRQDGNAENEAARQVDMNNRWYWKKPHRRLDAESLRDATLVVSGTLNRRQFGPAIPVMADRVGQFVIGIENLNAGRPGAVIAMKGEDFRRSVYVQVRRSRPLGILETFDAPRMDPNCTVRTSSTVAPQALHLMNSPFVHQHARTFADRLLAAESEDEGKRLELGWMIAYSRSPSREEAAAAKDFLRDQEVNFSKIYRKGENKDGKAAERMALTSLCHALLSSNEFIYID